MAPSPTGRGSAPAGLRRCLGDRRLLLRRPLGLRLRRGSRPGWRLHRQRPRSDRLCRWHRGAHQRGRGCSRAGPRPRQAHRPAQGAHAPAQPAVRDARRRAAVVWLVRLQRRLRRRRRHHRGGGLGEHPRRDRCRRPGLAGRGEGARRARHQPRSCLRPRRRPGRHHAGLLVGQPAGRRRRRGHRRRALRPRRQPQVQAGLRRLPRRRRRPPGRRPRGHGAHRAVRHGRGARGRRRPVLRRRVRPAVAPGGRRRGRAGLLVRGVLRARQADRRHDRFRISQDDEVTGVDVTTHAESAYEFALSGGGFSPARSGSAGPAGGRGDEDLAVAAQRDATIGSRRIDA